MQKMYQLMMGIYSSPKKYSQQKWNDGNVQIYTGLEFKCSTLILKPSAHCKCNSEVICPSLCLTPTAQPAHRPPTPTLIPPHWMICIMVFEAYDSIHSKVCLFLSLSLSLPWLIRKGFFLGIEAHYYGQEKKNV